MKVKQYKAVQEPYKLEGGLNALTWSLPFLTIKVAELLEHMIKKIIKPKYQMTMAKHEDQDEVEFKILMQKFKAGELSEEDTPKLIK